MRLDLLPAFRSLHPAAEANLVRTAALLAEDDAALDALAAERAVRGRRARDGGGRGCAAARSLRRALRRVAGFPAPRPVAAERLGALARARAGAGSVPLGGGRVAERRYGRIVVVRGAPPEPPRHEVALAVPGRTPSTATRSFTARSRPRRRRSTPRSRHCSLLRAPRAGERLPGARRTIARMLLEARVPRSERARYPVVSADGEAVALPGIAVAPALRRPSGLVLTFAAT